MLDNILTKASLAEKVESLVKSEKMSYIEAVIHICNEMGVDPADRAGQPCQEPDAGLDGSELFGCFCRPGRH